MSANQILDDDPVKINQTSSHTKLWGEIQEQPETFEVPDVREDIKLCMNRCTLTENVEDTENTEVLEQIMLPPMDPLIQYAVLLHKHENDMNEMIRLAELAVESHLIPPEDAKPVMPDMPPLPRKSGNESPKNSDFNLDVIELSPVVVRQILTKSIAVLFAHIGYETTHQSILNILTDVLYEFMKKITYHLKVAEEDKEKGHFSGFPSPIERVLVELGLGGTKGLCEYYNNRVVKYIFILQKRCEDLNRRYERLLIRKFSPVEENENKVIRVKVEEDDDVIEIDNPQVHLALDGELGFSSLEPGFQLLNSLEAEASSQSMIDTEDEGSITISPGIATIQETDLSSLSPYSKKKKK